MLRIHNRMLRARIMKLHEDKDCAKEEQAAFQLLRDGLLGVMSERKSHPILNVYSDQIVWGRSPVRIDVAGGGRTHLPTLFIQGKCCKSCYRTKRSTTATSICETMQGISHHSSLYRHGCNGSDKELRGTARL